MVATRRRRCPQRTRLGADEQRRPLGVVARRCGCRLCLHHRVGVLVRRPVSGAGVQCPRVPVQATTVQRPVRRLGVHVSDVRCPAWVSGVRAFPRPLCPTGKSWRVAVGQTPWLGWPGSAWSPAVSTAGSSSAGSEPGGRGWRRPGLDLAVVVRGGWAVARSTAWQTRRGRMRARIALLASRGAQRGGDYAAWSSCEAEGRVAWSLKPPGLDCDLSLRPCCGRKLQ
jgi:hypothetical protein